MARSATMLATRKRLAVDAPPEVARAAVPLQRSAGSIDLVVSRVEDASRATRIFQQGAMKVRFPKVATDEPPEAVLINTAGGLTGGDTQHVGVTVETCAAAVLTTQACERLYRSSGKDAAVTVRLTIGAGGTLEWLPQPLIFFNAGRLRRETHVDLSCDATLLAVESVIFGRLASGETVSIGALSDAWFVRRAGRLIHAERFACDGDIGTTLDKATVLGGNRAMATVRYIAPDAEQRLQVMRALVENCGIEAAASAWKGMLLARFVAVNGYELNCALTGVLSTFRGKTLPKAWLL